MIITTSHWTEEQGVRAVLEEAGAGEAKRLVCLSQHTTIFVTAAEARQLATSLTEIAAQIDASVIAHQVIEQVAS